MDWKLNDLDRRIWEEELADFVPGEIYDAHTHLYDWRMDSTEVHNESPPGPGRARLPLGGWSELEGLDAALLPGRRVHRISFPCPVQPAAPDEINAFAAREVRHDPQSIALMHVRPNMDPETIDAQITALGVHGFKPYRVHASTGDEVECRITDYLPESQIDIADKHGLLVMLHLSKRRAIADEQNLADLERLTADYPRVQWILAHCARSYYDRPLLIAADRLKQIPNLWYEISSVCDSDAMDVLLSIGGPDRVMYGSDGPVVSSTRGKYITFGDSWSELNERNHTLKLDHCDGRFTFVGYECLRAFRRACRRHGYGPEEHEKLFYTNASVLVGRTRQRAVQATD